MNDNRVHNRRKISRLRVVAGGSIQCELLDISLSGARLSCTRELPDTFYLMLKPDLKRWCQVVWRHSSQVGVKFIEDRDALNSASRGEPKSEPESVSKGESGGDSKSA